MKSRRAATRTGRQIVLGLSLCAAAVWIGSCAAKSSKSVAGAPPTATGGGDQDVMAAMSDSKDDIRAWWMQIREWRVERGMSADPPWRLVNQAVGMSIKDIRLCADDPEPSTEVCTDVCSIKDAICDNAEQICRVAADLNDAWADDKCKSAKASCKEATEKCCECAAAEPSQPSDVPEPSGTPGG